MDPQNPLSDLRREYGQRTLNAAEVPLSPIEQFEIWLAESIAQEQQDPNAMTLATVDEHGHPDVRIVLLKAITAKAGFVFYSNYLSTKGQQIQKNPYVALNFYWPILSRQVRVRGKASQVTAAESDVYFSSRPIASQLSAIISPQSQAWDKDQAQATLNDMLSRHIATSEPLKRPKHWGGYAVFPQQIEFWQGRDNRFHDRVQYYLEQGQWFHRQIAP